MKRQNMHIAMGVIVASLCVLGARDVAASYEVIADVFTGADSGVAVSSFGYTMTLSVSQRCVVGPPASGAVVVVAPGYQAMIQGLRGLEILSDEVMKERVVRSVGELRKLYGFAGALSFEEGKALVNRRKEVRQRLLDELSALGAGGARVMGDFYPESRDIRDKILLIEALGQVDDPNAANVLGELLDGGEEFSVQREIVAALGNRSEEAAERALSGLLDSSDYRMGMAAAQGLSGRPGAVDLLSRTVLSEEAALEVRKEAVRSLGLVENEAALEALATLALSEVDLGVRQTAIQELGRSYGEEALDTLEAVLSDPDEKIRKNVLKAVARVPSERATAMLKQVAVDDESEIIREWADGYLKAREEVPRPTDVEDE